MMNVLAAPGPSNANIGRAIKVYDNWADNPEAKVMYTGVFHGFSQDIMLLNKEYKQITTAIIEQDDGIIEIVPVQRCKFEPMH